jgi:hypothetical protein
MIHLKRSTGFHTHAAPTPYPTPSETVSAHGAPYAAMGFIARCSDGQLLMRYAPQVTMAPRRRHALPA